MSTTHVKEDNLQNQTPESPSGFVNRAYVKDGKMRGAFIFTALSQLMCAPMFGFAIEWKAKDEKQELNIRQEFDEVGDGKVCSPLKEQLGATSNMLWALGAGEEMEIERLPKEDGIKHKFTVTIKEP